MRSDDSQVAPKRGVCPVARKGWQKPGSSPATINNHGADAHSAGHAAVTRRSASSVVVRIHVAPPIPRAWAIEVLGPAKDIGHQMDFKTETQLRHELAEVWRMYEEAQAAIPAAVAAERARLAGVEQYLEAAADGSMSRNNSETLAAELLAQIRSR